MSVAIRVRGTVQGVGFRPMVWRVARRLGLSGEVSNDALGVLIRASGEPETISEFVRVIEQEAPLLSRIDQIETELISDLANCTQFRIVESREGETRTQVTPDAATCSACVDEILDPSERRFGYPFTNCTHCGPRFSIIVNVPYDRATTTMAPFDICANCLEEYRNPNDRRFHAQPIACDACGPKLWVEALGEFADPDEPETVDAIEKTGSLLRIGKIVAIRGLGGFHLCCDATHTKAVARLREHKRRIGKPFALMARDTDVIERFCRVSEMEKQLLESPEAPIVLMEARGYSALPDTVAPGMNTLGVMLPTTPLHHLLLEKFDQPLIMTSGNISDEPQIISNEAARAKLKDIADFALLHDREIANRIDDSVVRVMDGRPRLIRRARGYAPGAITLPKGFETTPDILAFGGELKATFCLLKEGSAILSQHQGDLEHPAAYDDYCKNLALYRKLYDHQPKVLVADLHPEYLSGKLAKSLSDDEQIERVEVQHHHAHITSCMAENGVPLNTDTVLGIALDGLGYGEDGKLWGGEFLLADYRTYRRIGTFKPVALLGGAQAIKQPWRSTYAHLCAAMGWEGFSKDFSSLPIFRFLYDKPRATLDKMLDQNINAPLASSCGRLFDAVAAALGLAQDQSCYEGQGAIELEAIIDHSVIEAEIDELAYPFSLMRDETGGIPILDPSNMWRNLLNECLAGVEPGVISARFHKGLAIGIAKMVETLVATQQEAGRNIKTVVLSGGCFQNRVLLESVSRRVALMGLRVLSHARVPANDGGLALGQIAIAAARHIAARNAAGGR